MRITRNALHLSLALLAAVSLSACDFGEQPYETEEGENLSIRGPGEAAVPNGTAEFNIFPFTIDKDYEWSVEGPGDPSFERRRSGEFIDVSFDQPGSYTVTVDDGEYTGETTFTASYPDIVDQAGRFGFGRLGTALGTAGLADTLGTGGPFTVFAPTDAAFVSALDTTDDGSLNLPAASVLSDILAYHVVPDSLGAGALGGSQETLEGGALMFETSGGDVQVTDGSDATGPATVTNANVPAANGLIHAIDALRLPPTASVAFNDQTAVDSVNTSSVYVPENGFVAIHDSTLFDGVVQGSVIGVSEQLEPGVHNDVPVALFDEERTGGSFEKDSLQTDQTLIAMPHKDTNDNGSYDFLTSNGAEDGAYTEGGSAVIDSASITVPGE
jgi:uncharacterized surface protein with fasciclin (FAS1) repeats